MNKLFTKIAALALGAAMVVGVGVSVGSKSKATAASAADAITMDMTDGFSSSRGTATTSSTTKKTGYYQDNGTKNSSICTFQVLDTTALWTTTPSSITFTANLGGGTAKDSLTYPIEVQLLSSNGSTIGTKATVTNKIDQAGSKAYSCSISVVNNAYGIKLTHMKEDGWNARYYSATLSYVAGSGPVEIATTTTVTAADNKTTLTNGQNPADTVQLTSTVKDSSQNVVSGASVTYSGYDTSVVSVSNSGLVTAEGLGTTTITATFSGGTISQKTYSSSHGTIEITVKAPEVPVPSSGSFTFTSSDLAVNDPSQSSDYDKYKGTQYANVDNSQARVALDVADVIPGTGGNTGKLQFRASKGVLYNTRDLGNIVSVTVDPGSSTAPAIYYGKTVDNITLESLENGCGFFKVFKNSSNAGYYNSVTVTWGTPVTLNGIDAELNTTAVAKTYYVDDSISNTDLNVTTSYSDSSLNSTITDGTGVFFDSNLEATTYTFTESGESVSVPVYYRDANGRTANTTLSVTNVQPARQVVAWSYEGTVGDTQIEKPFDLSTLTLKAWYDQGKTQEAPATVEAKYELVANPANAGATENPNNTITLEVYLKTDTSHSNLLASFNDVAAPVVVAPKGSEDNPYTVAEAIAAINGGTDIPTGTKYVTGFIKRFGTGGTAHAIWLVDNPDTDMSLDDNKCLEAFVSSSTVVPTPEGVDFDNDIYPYDKVTISGTLAWFASASQPEVTSYSIVEWHEESINLVLSLSEDTLILNSEFSYSGTITADFAVWNDKVLSASDVTFSNNDTSTVGDKTVTVSYNHPMYEEPRTATYTLHVINDTLESVSFDTTQSVMTKTEYFTDDTNYDYSGIIVSGVFSATGQNPNVNSFVNIVPDQTIAQLGRGKHTIHLTAESKVDPTVKTSSTFNVDIQIFDAKDEMDENTTVADYDFTQSTVNSGQAVNKAFFDDNNKTTVNNLDSISSVTAAYMGNTQAQGGESLRYGYARLSSGKDDGTITLTFNQNVNQVTVEGRRWSNNTADGFVLDVNGDSFEFTDKDNHETHTFTFSSTDTVTFSATTSRSIFLYKLTFKAFNQVSKSDNAKAVYRFTDNYLHMVDYVEEIVEGEPVYQNWCLDSDSHHYYQDAVSYYNNTLNEEQRILFQNDAFVAERARFVAWAAANNKLLTFDSTTGAITITPMSMSLINNMFATPESTATAIIIIVSVIGVSALGGFFFLRKRKEI